MGGKREIEEYFPKTSFSLSSLLAYLLLLCKNGPLSEKFRKEIRVGRKKSFETNLCTVITSRCFWHLEGRCRRDGEMRSEDCIEKEWNEKDKPVIKRS